MGSNYFNLLAVFSVLGTLACGSFLWPRLALIALWSACYLYPNAITAQALPLNIGGDDLAVVLVMAVVLARRLAGGRRIVFGPVFTVGVLVLALEIFSSLVGIMLSQYYPIGDFLKSVVKHTRPIMIALTVLNACDDMDELRRGMYGFIIFSSLAFAVAAAQNLGVRFLDIFNAEHWLQYTYEAGTERYSGIFDGPWALAAVAVLVGPLSLSLLILGTVRMKVLAAFGLACSVAGVFYSQSRGGMVALGLSFLAALVFIRKRAMTVFVLVTVALGAAGSGLIAVVAPRWQRAGVQEFLSGDTMARTPLEQRLYIMAETLRDVPSIGWVTGVGQDVIRAFTEGKAHNMYLQIWLGYGLAGVALAVWVLIKASRSLMAARSLPVLLPTAALREGMLLSIVGMLALGLTAEVVGGSEFHDALMAMAALTWVHLRLAGEAAYDTGIVVAEDAPAFRGGATW